VEKEKIKAEQEKNRKKDRKQKINPLILSHLCLFMRGLDGFLG